MSGAKEFAGKAGKLADQNAKKILETKDLIGDKAEELGADIADAAKASAQKVGKFFSSGLAKLKKSKKDKRPD